MILQLWLAWFFNSHWHNCSPVTGKIVQQSLTQLFNSHRHNCSTVTGTIVQQSLTQLFNSHWHDCSTVTGMIIQQSGTVVQQSWARFFLFSMLAEFFNIDVHCWRIMLCTRNTTHDSDITAFEICGFNFIYLFIYNSI